MCNHPKVVPVPKSHFFNRVAWVCLLLALAALANLAQAEPGGNPALDAAFQSLVKLELGQNLGIFNPIRQAVLAARTNEEIRADLEGRLIAVLQGDATDLAKDYACRQLVIVGSDASLPALAALLTNPRMAYMARYALEGIGSPTVKQTLRDMLAKTAGQQKIGVVISLGRLADADAVSPIAGLLQNENDALREVCLIALGRIGNAPAAEAIQAFAAKTPESLQQTLLDAQLDAVESLCLQGDHKRAAEICNSLLASDSEDVKAAAFRGLLAASPSESMTMVIDALKSDEPWRRAVAADWVVGLDSPDQIQTIAAAAGDLPPAGKVAAFLSLKYRCHSAIREAALKALDQPQADVRSAALVALINSGAPADVPTLAALMVTTEDAQLSQAVFETLRLMPAEGVNQALIAWMDQANPLPPLAVQCALARRSPDFLPAFLKAAQSDDTKTRLEAFKALEVMATDKNAGALVALLGKTTEGEEREAAGRAVWMSCQKIADPAQRSAPLLAAMEKGDANAQCAILPTLARIGSPEALPAVRKAMQSGNQAVRDAGYRALANWPDATVADELLEIVKNSKFESYRIWSLRAYARVVALPSERAPQKTFEMLRDAMKLASRTEDRELFVSRLSAVRVPDALAFLLPFIDNGELQKAALPAVFTLAKGLSQSHPDQAAAALKKIQPLVKDAALQQQIPKVLRDIDARKQDPNKK